MGKILKGSKVRTQDRLEMCGTCHDEVPATSKRSLRKGIIGLYENSHYSARGAHIISVALQRTYSSTRAVEVHWYHNLGNYGGKVPLFSQQRATGRRERDRKKEEKSKGEGKKK